MDSARVPVAAAPTNGTSARGPTREPDVEHDTAARDSGAPTTVTSPRGSVADSTSGDRGSTSSRSTAIGRPVYDVIERARYEDIAMRLVMQESLEQIASALDLDVTNVRRIIKRPGFRAVYEDVHRKVYDDLSGLIKNEKAAPLLRLNAKSIRVQTMLGEIIEEVRKRVETGKARSMDLKVGVEAAFGILDRTGHGTAGRNGRGTNVVNITFNQGTAEIFKNATQEAGLDLSDLRDYIDVEAVPVETEETTDDDNGEPEP